MLKVFTFRSNLNKVTIEIFSGQSFMYSPFFEHKIGNIKKLHQLHLKNDLKYLKMLVMILGRPLDKSV